MHIPLKGCLGQKYHLKLKYENKEKAEALL